MKLELKVYSDPGHAWLQVSRTQLDLLPRHVQEKISRFSYRSAGGRYAYLEEDVDAGIFLDYVKNSYVCEVTMKTVHTNSQSRIRKLPDFWLEPQFRLERA